ncbi:intermembrane lipid transfer protein VPS13B isoform X1 [Diorhabda sublineata]|uniref:intermembrane lipid transfer protein VPS13B isoform X1 n=1 Tax=Diorhabda sublineata TaxID=1163346 RepID=UPI0024E136AE|nr:intermembrane lipid transfer protein VPS13B isoform X1 [Diorhabda sublineata]
MFKLESYITPILLSYVNRYINNFKLEDSQVSLWGGDASFNNLELNLQVLEQELQLPFSFVSGSIRELLIHVPWTKLASEPITITINTIECILNLKGEETRGRNDALASGREKKPGHHGKEMEAPQGYVQLLINKIVSNIRIYCNNLILKYVEEDIVLSMNVRHLKFESANQKWEPAYIDVSPAEVILRKVITINDLTLCLDKRNASGKIEVYQEPMLYKCSMTMHLLKKYHSATANIASTTRLDIYCNNMEFSMTEQQVPMFMRLLMLLYALHQKQLKPELNGTSDGTNTTQDSRDTQDNSLGWTGWAWSYVSSVLPAPWDDDWDNKFLQDHKGHTLHFGIYVDNLSITFKISETTPDRSNYYNQKKQRYTPMLCLKLQGIYSEIIIHGLKWFNAMGGVSYAVLLPLGVCSCSYIEIVDESVQMNYLKIGSETDGHKTDSLFDAEAAENKGKKRQYNTSWDVHMTVYSESVLLERTPAFSFDYLYQMDMPSDTSSEVLSEMGSDFEFSNFMENSSMRICFGPFKLRLCSGFFHRISTLQAAASYYDYPPYANPKPEKSLQELHPPSEEDFDALNEFIPSRSMRITFFAPIIELELMDHPYFQPTKGMLYKKRKKLNTIPVILKPLQLPKLTLECQFLDISLTYPMYVNRLVHTTCQLPDPPIQLFEACYNRNNIKIVGLCSRLIITSNNQTTILTPSSFSYTTKSINKSQYWTNPDIAHEETTFESESITLNGTNAKMMVVFYIIGKLFKMDAEEAVGIMNNTSILTDATKDHGLPFMELCIESIRFKKVKTNSTVSIDASLGSIKGFIFEPVHTKNDVTNSNDIQQVLFISGPEPKSEIVQEETSTKIDMSETPPLFTVTVQYPISPDNKKHPPILLFNLQEIRVCVDPLLCRWLLYTPKQFGHKLKTFDTIVKTRNVSEASGSIPETSRKTPIQIESVHSSSDREPHFTSNKAEISEEEPVDVQEKIYNFLKKWFDVWKGMFLYGDVSQCTIYFPLVSLSAIGSQGIQEAVDSAVNKDRPPDIMVITLPFANIRSAHRQSIKKHLTSLPISLPDTIWSPDKSSFPWTMSISDMSCYTVQYGNKLIFLKPVSLSATVGLSTRATKAENESTDVIKPDLGYLGVCVHIDMTPIVISTSEVQVYLFAGVLYGLMEVASNLMPEKIKHSSLKTPEVLPAVMSKNSSTLSPTIMRENTVDSVSDKTPPIAALSQQDTIDESVKLTAWVQWTVTRFTIELLSNEYRGFSEDLESLQPRLKLVVDAEDIVSSLDFQSVYLKIKSKIGSVSIQHYKRLTSNSKWQPGPFSGIVMRLREDIGMNQRHEDNGFVNITITRASCQHTHTLWGAVQKRYHKEPKRTDPLNSQLLSQSRYITEIVVNVQPIDFIISLKTLRSFYLVVVPLLQIPLSKEPTILDQSTTILNANNQNLPLTYLECQDIRIVIPSVELQGSGSFHDVVIFQVQKICMSPSAVNPICRTPLRPDIYEQAAHARILNVPGSEVEDRQYQLDLLGISICTGIWEDINSVFSSTNPTLKGLSENPALEWNNLDQGQPNFSQPILNLWHITEKFDISLILAPAMVYKDTTIICGHSLEINLVTDIMINLSLQQIKLLSALLSEFIALMEPLVVDENFVRPKLILPYSRSRDTTIYEEEIETCELFRDSGIETSDIKSLSSRLLKTLSESERYVVPKSTTSLLGYCIPFDVLFTAGKISLGLHQVHIPPNGSQQAKNKRRRSQKVDNDEAGYEAEEEGIVDKENNYNQYLPLVYVSVNQPNLYLNKKQLIRVMQLTCFDLRLKLSGPEYPPINHVPNEEDFPVNIVETRSGTPDVNTGIFPAFFTGKFSKGVSKNATIDIEISKPTKILCSTSKWGYLLIVKDKVLDAFKGNKKDLIVMSKSIKKQISTEDITTSVPSISSRNKSTDTYGKFQEIKDTLGGTNVVNVNFNQLIIAIQSDSGHEIHFGVEKMLNTVSLLSRPEKISLKTNLHCITLSVINGVYKKLLLNPWTVSIDVSVFWESWQTPDSDPQVQISVESDCVIVDVGSEQLKCLQVVIKEINEFVSTLPFTENVHSEVASEPLSGRGYEKDQHYKDDLRAGAFQFIDAVTENTEELPLPYQVMFWNKSISAMAWRYPQPRALTKVRVFPVPYKMTLGYQDDSQVLCHLEYWSECRNSYLPFTQFYLSESEVCHLTLPETNPQPVVASTWRVVITMVNNNEDQSTNVLISPRALAACMRIDSYFNKSFIPNLTAALYITKIDLSFYNYFDRYTTTKLPDYLKNYTPDYMFPENQRFLTLTLYNITGYLLNWEMDYVSSELSAAVKCNVLDYNFLTEQTFIEPFTCKLEAIIAEKVKFNFISKPVQIKIGPNVAHCLAVATQVWDQNYSTANKENDFLVMTNFIICNDTVSGIRFGQAGTEEDILLLSRQFHLYSWRSQKKKQKLRIALEENDWVWSRCFTISEDKLEIIEFSTDRNISVFVTVQSLSATQKKITIFGQLIVSNMLLEHFDMKVVEAVKENKDIEFKNTPTILVPSHNNTPSIFINGKKKYFLRLRFFGLDSAWTGDIPLMEHHTGSQPWLVKVPLQERGQFLSIWCRIITQDINQHKRILAVLWPLFTVKSNLPIESQVHIETPTLNVHLDCRVEGRGRIQQLYCPGTIDHSHQLTFRIDNNETYSNPYIPLNYSLVDQDTFFKKPEKVDIETILITLKNFNDKSWPYFGEELDEIDWVVEDQPLTHVQVRYQNACPYSCSLLVELLPWCLTVNTLGVPISLMSNGTELCRIPHHGIVAPPKLEDNFNLGTCMGGSWYYSEPLQLAKSDWSQAFYMPKITGTIPQTGFIKTVINCDNNICSVLISSSVNNDMRLLKISSTHVLSNHMGTQVQVICLAVPEGEKFYDFPDNIEPYSFTLAPYLNKTSSGVSIIKWHTLANELDTVSNDYVLYLSFCVSSDLGWSCPVRVDKTFLKRSICITSTTHPIPAVLTCQEHKGQLYISLHNDPRPQLLIINKTGVTFYCAQSLTEYEVIEETQHFKWYCKIAPHKDQYYNMSLLSDKFPELPQFHYTEKLALASESDNGDYQWSTNFSLTHDYEQYLRIPFYGDIHITVVNTACTTFLILDSGSEMEISASDIRVRLSMQEVRVPPIIKGKTISEPLQLSKLYDPEELPRSLSDTVIPIENQNQRYNTKNRSKEYNSLDESLESKRRWSESNVSLLSPKTKSLLVRTLPMSNQWDCLNFNAFINAFTVIFISGLKAEGTERWEVASLVFDNIVIVASQTEKMKLKVSVAAIQFDNQLYSRESYDFPVMLIGQDTKELNTRQSLNIPIENLIQTANEDDLFILDIVLETWRDKYLMNDFTGAKSVNIIINPISCFVEDRYITKLMDYFNVFIPTKLILWPDKKIPFKLNGTPGSVSVPELVSWQCAIIAKPLTIRNLSIAPISLLLSVHSSIKLYIALDQSPLQFGSFERRRIVTTPYRLGHALTMHYLSGAIFGAGWVVSSLELIGSPGGLARAMGTGLRDFVSLPYRGLVVGPMAFLRGITQGSASLMKHVTAGTLQSVTKLASSVARNLDRLTLDEEHVKRTEEQRRQRPQGLAQGFLQGLTGLGISLLGAIGGVAHHPLQSMISDGASPRSLVTGVGLGLVGMVTKPLSGAAELVALTGQGLLQGAGWTSLPEPRTIPSVDIISQNINSILKYSWKNIQTLSPSHLLYVTEATNISNSYQYEATALILTLENLIVINLNEDLTQRVINLADLSICPNNDPTLLVFKLTSPLKQPTVEEDGAMEMDPVSRARVAEYVKNTVGVLHLPDTNEIVDRTNFDISPLSSPSVISEVSTESTVLTYYVNLQSRNYFICLLNIAKQQRQNYNFPIL